MSKPFKYKVVYKCKSQKEATEILSKLHELGYECSSTLYRNYTEKHTYLQTKWNSVSNGYGFGSDTHGEYECNSKELFLALTSQVDSEEYHVGEYFTSKEITWTDIYPVIKVDENDRIWTKAHTSDYTTSYTKQQLRKATKEEIIQHFITPKEIINPIEKESLVKVGTKFIVGTEGIIYTISSIIINTVTVSWNTKEGNNSTGYTIKQVEKHFAKGTWTIIKEETINTMNKEIIGYKLNGVVSKEIADKVLSWKSSDYNGLYFIKGHLGGSLVLEAKRLDILDKWFEPVYEDKVELIVGNWYYVDIQDTEVAFNALVNFQGLDKCAYGFNHSNKWTTHYAGSSSSWTNSKHIITLASQKDVKARLIQEAKDRGYTKGTKINCVEGQSNSERGFNISDNFHYNHDENLIRVSDCGKYHYGFFIYSKGKWAEILPSTPDITINGYKGEFFDTYVAFGCAKFYRDLFYDLVNINNMMNTSNLTNRQITSIKLGLGEFTYKQIEEINNYYLNK